MARPSFLVIVLLAGALSLRGGGEAGAQTPHAFASAEAARGLVRLLDGSGVTAVATTDPSAPDVFVAALYIPRGQLLVVSGRHPSQEAVRYRIAMQQYREVYLDLQASPTREGKFFVQDANADGILSAASGSGDVDVLYEDGVRQTLFNGDPRRQSMTPAEYDARLAAADATYARLLTLLTSELEKGGAEESVLRHATGTVTQRLYGALALLSLFCFRFITGPPVSLSPSPPPTTMATSSELAVS